MGICGIPCDILLILFLTFLETQERLWSVIYLEPVGQCHPASESHEQTWSLAEWGSLIRNNSYVLPIINSTRD